MDPTWVRAIRRQCIDAAVPFLFKQWGDWYPLASADEASQFPKAPLADDHSAVRIGKKRAGRLIDGLTWNEYPTAVRS
jgi:protein gp37